MALCRAMCEGTLLMYFIGHIYNVWLKGEREPGYEAEYNVWLKGDREPGYEAEYNVWLKGEREPGYEANT